MSALAGIVAGEDLSPLVEKMLTQMSYRARDGRALFTAGGSSMGLGYKRRQVEDPTEAQIYEARGIRLICDVRLDNRSDLLAKLGLDNVAIPDAELVLAAYNHWKEECVEHLLGDFAFAVLDTQSNLLFLARDHMGVRPLFYRQDGDKLGFASEAAPLLRLAPPFSFIDFSKQDRNTITSLLSGEPSLDADNPVASVQRVPPGHTVSYRFGSVPVIRSYWKANPSLLEPGQLPEEAFRTAFEEAVRCRLRSAYPLSALLSGGLDSTSIACCAAQSQRRNGAQMISTFSAVFNATPAYSERSSIESVLKFETFNHTYIDCSNYAPFCGFTEAIKPHVSIPLAPGFGMNIRLVKTMAEAGFLSYLDGHGGDEVVSHGYGRLDELAHSRMWQALWREIKGVSKLFDERPSILMSFYILKYGQVPGRRVLRRIFRFFAKLRSPNTNVLKKDLQVEAAVVKAPLSHRNETERHQSDMRDPSHVAGLEVLELNAARNGMDILLPFYDVRLIELCLALPSQAKLEGGWTRLVLRKAMEGVIPAHVQWRQSKFDFSPHIAMGILTHHATLIEEIICERPYPIVTYANIDRVALAYKRVRRMRWNSRRDDTQVLWKILALWFWLKRHQHDQTTLVEQNV